jgi:hypothetical protein
MKSSRENMQRAYVVLRKPCWIPGVALLAVLFLILWPAGSAMAQSNAAPAQSSTASQSQSQAQSQPASQSAPPAQSAQDAQTDSATQPQSLGDAARKANAQKDKPKSKHVYTDDDVSSIGGTISVVGNGSSARGSADNANSGAGNATQSSASKDEAYWRQRADAIKGEIADVDRQIDAKKDEIAKAGATSFDPSAGLSQGVIIIHDRNAELKELEDRKQSLENQLDELADEGRKAGADSGWFR